MSLPQKIKFVIVAILCTVFSLFIVEICLQLLNKPEQWVSGWTKCRNSDQCNYLNFRGSKIDYSPEDFVIVLLGDSLVAAWAVDFEHIPERRLEHYLRKTKKNVKVFTLGTVGYGQDQQYLALKKYFEKHRANLVVLFFSAQTDINDNIFPVSGRNNTIKPTFWLDGGELKGPTERWLDEVGTKFKLLLLWQKCSGDTPGVWRNEYWEMNILPPPYQPLTEYDGEVDYSWQERWKENPVVAYKGIEFEKVGPTNQFAPRSKRRQYGIDLTKKLFSRMKNLVESQGGHFIIFKEERPWELEDTEREKVFFLKGKYYKTSMKQYRKNLEDLFNGFEHYRIPLNLKNVTVSEEDRHLSRNAIDLLMKRLADIISMKPYFSDRQSGRS
jgi:hypothetical protein